MDRNGRYDPTHPKLWQLDASGYLWSKKMGGRPPNISVGGLENFLSNFTNYKTQYGLLYMGGSRTTTEN
jgi:hypothetical protein